MQENKLHQNPLRMICMDSIQAVPVTWLWYPYIPYGKITIIQGDPGEGKTTLVLHLAAALTQGRCPGSEEACEPVTVIYQTAEDGMADTIKPRLLSAGADCTRVLFIDESRKCISMTDDRLEEAIRQTDARLVILDPIQAYLGADVDMHRANEIRPIMSHLGGLAEQYGCAIVLIGHMNKAVGVNARQTRPCRRIADYYAQIAAGHREEAFYEVIVQLGDCKTVPFGSTQWDAARRMLHTYMQDFERRNPNLYVFNASLHLDEASPHLHIDFVPYYTKPRQRGLRKGVSLRAALTEQGFAPQHGRNQLEQWEEAERGELESILYAYGYAREEKQAHYRHLEISEYKTLQDARKMQAALQEENHISVVELTAGTVQKLRTELRAARHTVQQLETEKHSPYQSFYYASDDKQAFVQQELQRQGIPFREAENGFEAQACYLKVIREIERSYRTPAASHRDKLREDIDRMLMRSASFQELLQYMIKAGYEIRMGKYIAVKPRNAERFIRLKSLGENYSEWVLRNRIRGRLRFEQEINDKIGEAEHKNLPTIVTLKTVQIYTRAFVSVSLPMRRRKPDKPFSWTNDAELEKLLALNSAINQGKTPASIRADFTRLTEQEHAAAQAVVKAEAYSDDTEALRQRKSHHAQIREQLQHAADLLNTAEKVFGGTYVQHLVETHNLRRQSEYLPSGYYPADGRRR